ncbi:Chemosensory protein [Operophtera brumata]|uniref:Chemosensory protein n=1 Tax=Operophtera brumata TaxID=104452 RepID=A0A0L7KY96_OPEBR|nr:Chemosensory protein [Operophtera brumata]
MNFEVCECEQAICASLNNGYRFTRELSDGVRSLGYKVVYGESDMTAINQVVDDMEKSDIMKSKVPLNKAIPVMPAEDVKCLMSVDSYYCGGCSPEDKEAAGRVMSSLMVHDPVAWKMFLTRYADQEKIQRSALLSVSLKKATGDQDVLETLEEEIVQEKGVWEDILGRELALEVIDSSHQYTEPGFNVRVKRTILDVE